MKRTRSSPATPFPLSPAAIATAISILLLSGCATAPVQSVREPAPEIKPAETQAPPPAKPAKKPRPVTQAPVQPAPTSPEPRPVEESPARPGPLTEAQLTIRIETHPQGAMIVVDGRPVGRSPLDLVVDTTNNGFFKQPVTIRARFLATDENSETFSVDEQLTPLERVPLSLVFSKDGVQRILRQF